jgi:hypothetical protein
MGECEVLMKYNVNFEHGLLKVKDSADKTVLKFRWGNANTIEIECDNVVSRHTRRKFDVTFLHYHAMLELHEFIELEDFFNDSGSVTKFRDFGKKIAKSYSPETAAVERKLRKHLDAGNPDKVAVYLVEAFSTDDANAEFASQWKANLPPVKAVFDCQSDIFREAAEYLKADGWKVMMVNDPDHGHQLWCLDQNGQGYHSTYDWSQDE